MKGHDSTENSSLLNETVADLAAPARTYHVAVRVIILCCGTSRRSSLVVDDLTAALRRQGADVMQLCSAQLPSNAPLPAADVVVLKDKSQAGLALGKRFHLDGVPTITPYPATELCRNKLATNQILERAGLPVPDSHIVRGAADLQPLLSMGPVILKPVRGSRGRGITIIDGPGDVPNIGDEEVFVQRYLKPDGLDLKIYRIGAEYFCVERPWPPKTLQEKLGRLVDLDDEMLGIAQACGDAVGCTVYGVDVIKHGGRPWVVDMSSFPGFKGVPRAGYRLARVVMQAG